MTKFKGFCLAVMACAVGIMTTSCGDDDTSSLVQQKEDYFIMLAIVAN